MAIICSHCGRRNRGKAMFCQGCAARLGAEPTDAAAFGALPAAAAPQPDARLDPVDAMLSGDMGVPPAPIPGPARSSGFKAGWIGLLLLAVWAAYMMGSGQWTLQSLIAARSEAPEPRPAAEAPAATAVPSPAVPSAMQQAPAPAAVPKPDLEAAKAPDALPAPSGDLSMASLERLFGAPPDAATPARRQAAPQPPTAAVRESRPPRAQPGDAAATTAGPAWVEPAREPVNTAAPTYRDAGPPIVAGPGPVAGLGPTSQSALAAPGVPEPRTPVRSSSAADAGPPVGPGPGPRYDFSSPGASPR